MAKAKETTRHVDVADDKGLQRATAKAFDQAQAQAKEGNVETVSQKEGGPTTDLPTGARSHPPQ